MTADRVWSVLRLGLLAVLPLVLVLGFRLARPDDLDNNDQAKQALYVLDIYQNGNWILPQERGVNPATKPPLYAWLATASAGLLGGVSELSCRLPSIVASLLVALLIFQIGRERWSVPVGLAAAWMFACSHTAIDLAIHVRPDMLLTLLVGLSLFALHRADLGRMQHARAIFWTGLSLSALAKGPVGPLLVLAPLAVLCISPERRARMLSLLRSRWAWSLALPVGWVVLAYGVGGSAYIHETILPETVDRVLATGSRSAKGVVPGYLVGHFLAKFLPWSLLALVALAQVLVPRLRRRDPALVLPVAFFATGLLLLNLSRGQRQDYLLPLLPAAALAASAVLLRGPSWIGLSWRAVLMLISVVVLSAGTAVWVGRPQDPALLAALGELGPAWAIALWLSSAVLLLISSSTARAVRPLSLLAAVVALLVLHAAYDASLSPVARSARALDVRQFASLARAQTRPGERVRIVHGVSGSVFFHMGQNDASLTLKEIASYDPTPGPGRELLLCRFIELEKLDERWPGRFRSLLRQPVGEPGQGLALVEDLAPKGGTG